MLKGSAAALTHWAERKRTDRSACSHQLAATAAQGPAGAHAPFRKENPQAGMKPPGTKGRLIAPLHLSFRKGFLKVPVHRTNPWTIMVKWGRGRGESGNGVEFWALENPIMAKEEDRTEG